MAIRPGIGLPVCPNTRNARNTRRALGMKNCARTRSGMGTGTNFKPVPVPEIPDLPEIEAVLGYFMNENENSKYVRKIMFFQVFFPKVPNISEKNIPSPAFLVIG